MTVLTWRDVASPNFQGVQDGLRNFSDLLNNGLNAARSGIDKFDQQRTDDVNNALLAQIAGAQNEDAAKALLANLSSNPNISRISAETIKAAMDRPNELIKQAGAESDLNFTNYTRDKLKASDAAMKMASPVVQQAGLLASSGHYDQAIKVLQDHPDQLGGLTAEQFLSSIKDIQGTASGDTSVRTGAFDYHRNVRDDLDNQDAVRLVGELRSKGLTQEDFSSYFEKNRDALIKQGYSPVAIEKARASLMGESPADATFGGTDPTGGLGGGGAGGDPTRVMNYQAAGAGFTAVPASVKTLGQASDFAIQVNKAGVPSSAMGVYQIVGDTLRNYAPKVFGANWQNVDFNAANQDKIAEAIFNDNKGSPTALQKQWTSLSAADAARAAKLPWEQARNIIAHGESGVSNVTALLAQATTNFQGQAGPQYNRANDPAQVFAQKAFPLLNDSSSPRQVAAKLVGQGGELAGENLGNVAAKIDSIAQKHGISPALAGLVLTSSLGGNQGVVGRVADFFNVGDGIGADVKSDSIDQFAKLAKNRDALIRAGQAAQANDQSAALVASTQQAQTAAAAALAAKARRAQALGRTFNPSAAIAAAATAGDLHDQALTNSAAITAAGGNQPAPPPVLNQRNVPRPAPKVAPVVFHPKNRMEMLLLQSLQNRGK